MSSSVGTVRGTGGRGPVSVIGTDIYGLDGNDNDGIGCE